MDWPLKWKNRESRMRKVNIVTRIIGYAPLVTEIAKRVLLSFIECIWVLYWALIFRTREDEQ